MLYKDLCTIPKKKMFAVMLVANFQHSLCHGTDVRAAKEKHLQTHSEVMVAPTFDYSASSFFSGPTEQNKNLIPDFDIFYSFSNFIKLRI